MSKIFTCILNKLWSLWFSLVYGRSFGRIGRGTFLFRPFRIHGAAGIEVGSNTVLQRGSWLYCVGVNGVSASLRLGNNCVFGYNNHITAVRKVVIGNDVLTANNVYISDNIHGYEDVCKPIMYQPVRFKKSVSIGNGCWIGENACIIGANIGKNCVIGANAVVTSDIPDYSVAVGVPAVVIKQYDMRSQEWVVKRRA